MAVEEAAAETINIKRIKWVCSLTAFMVCQATAALTLLLVALHQNVRLTRYEALLCGSTVPFLFPYCTRVEN